MELVAALPVEGGCWGETAAVFQRRDAAAILNSRRPFTFITRPRGGRKTADCAACAVADHMTNAPVGARSYFVAADAAQAGIALDTIRGFLLRAPILRRHKRMESRRVIYRDDQGEPLSSIEVLPADEASAYGLRPWLVFADELAVWPSTANARGLWTAVLSALPKVAGSRLVVATSAGDPAHWSASVLEHARTSPRWQLFETPGPLPWISTEALSEQRALLTESAYARLHENRWVAGEDRLTTPEQVRACIGHAGTIEPRRAVRYVHGLDVGLVSDATVLTIAHRERRQDGDVVVVDHQQVWQGRKDRPVDLSVVEAYCAEAVRMYPGRLIHDPWQSVQLAQRLRSKGVRTENFPFTSQSVGRIALTLYRLLRDQGLDLPDDDALIGELSSVVLRENQPGQYRIDHDADKHDDRVISLGLCAQSLAATWSGRASFTVPRGETPPTLPRSIVSLQVEPGVPIRRGLIPAEHMKRLGRFAIDRRFWTPPGKR
jgi:hypothetical protein